MADTTAWTLAQSETFMRALLEVHKASFGLHCRQDDEAFALGHAVAQACRDARAAYDTLDTECDASVLGARVLVVYEGVWSALARLPPGHPAYLPPIYRGSKMLNALIEEFIRKIRRREGTPAKCDTGHPIIGGVEGTGKTTIVKAMAMAVAACSPSFFLAYVNCRETYFKTSYLSSFAALLKSVWDDVQACHREASRTWAFHVGFVFDEIQEVAQPDAKRTEAQSTFLTDIQTFARNNNNALVVLTGSSSNLRCRLFRSSAYLSPYTARAYEGCVDFNKTLCAYHDVAALRTIPELAEYLARRYHPMPFDANTVGAILHETGGIGRHVHDRVVEGVLGSRTSMAPADAFKRMPDFRVFVTLILAKSGPGSTLGRAVAVFRNGGMARLAPADVGISFAILKPMLEEYVPFDESGERPTAEDLVHDWVDKGLAYAVYEGGSLTAVELARPADAVAYYGYHFAADDLLKLLAAWAFVYRPLSGIVAGKAIETLVRPHLSRLLPGWGEYAGQMMICDGELLVTTRDGEVECVSATVLRDVADMTFEWDRETGLDGVRFECEFAGDDLKSVVIHGWQSKAGHINLAITGGALRTYREKPNTSDMPDDNIAASVCRAERGFVEIAGALAKSLDSGVSIRLGLLHVTTTKEDVRLATACLSGWSRATKKYVDALAAPPPRVSVKVSSKDLYVIPRSVVDLVAAKKPALFPTPADCDALTKRCSLVYDCTLMSGPDWIPSCLPEQLAAMWRSFAPARTTPPM